MRDMLWFSRFRIKKIILRLSYDKPCVKFVNIFEKSKKIFRIKLRNFKEL